MIRNYMEVLVEDVMREVKDNYKIECATQIENAMAIALNNLPPKYFLSTESEGEVKAFLLDRQRRISVLAKVIEAIELACHNAS